MEDAFHPFPVGSPITPQTLFEMGEVGAGGGDRRGVERCVYVGEVLTEVVEILEDNSALFEGIGVDGEEDQVVVVGKQVPATPESCDAVEQWMNPSSSNDAGA